jgi:hypothetical protein
LLLLAPSALLMGSPMAQSASSVPRPALGRHLSPIGAPRMSIGASVEIVDRDGDKVSFGLSGEGELQLFVGDSLLCDAVQVVTYDSGASRVATVGQTDDDGGEFLLQAETQFQQAVALQELTQKSSAEWVDETTLPPQVEALLVDDTLKRSRPAVGTLWAQLLSVYPNEAAALEAIERNSAIVLPYLNRPDFILGSWKVINSMMSPDEALEVITKNPGVLACNPVALSKSDAATIKGAASGVDAVEAVPVAARWAGTALALAAVVGLVAANAS